LIPPFRPVLLYDRGCRVCRFAARVVARLDRDAALAFLDLRDPRAAEVLEPLPEAERFATWRLALPGREPVGYGRGGVDLLRTLRLTRPFSRALAIVPPRLLDGVYDLVARNRSSLGRLVPDGAGPDRFP
jgi:predicted DCC family thiol-disulfide oxidoreductase YuxK